MAQVNRLKGGGVRMREYPFAERFAALLARLRESEFSVQEPGGIEPQAPYLKLEPGGWEQDGGQLKPLVGVELIHEHKPNAYLIAHAAATEGKLWPVLFGQLLPRGAAPAAIEGEGAAARTVSRSLWRMP